MEITIGKQKIPLITGLLVAVNVVVYLVLEWLGSTEDGYFMVLHGALYGPAVLRNREFYRIFTAMFLHFGPAHLVNNMLMLYLVGQKLESAAGSIRTFLIYFISGAGANLFTLWFYELTGTDAVSAGASGALMGLIGGLLARIIREGKSLGGIDRRQMLMLAGFSLYSGFVSTSTNNAAHISGMVFGFLLGLVP